MEPDPRDGRTETGTAPRLLVALVLGGIVWRVLLIALLPAEGLKGDLDWHVHWLLEMARVGPGGFYAATAGEPVLTPVWSWLLWPAGIAGQLLSTVTGTSPAVFAPALVKTVTVTADVLIALVLAVGVRRSRGTRAGVTAAALYLVIPVTWIDSAVWGQLDAVGTLFALAALLCLYGRRDFWAIALACLAILTKPQFGVVALVVGVVFVLRHLPGGAEPGGRGDAPPAGRRLQGPAGILGGVAVAVGVTLLVIVPFDLSTRAAAGLAGVPVLGDVAGLAAVVGKLFGSATPLTANAFNPWVFVGPHPLVAEYGTRTFDRISLLGPIRAWMVGTSLLAGALLAGVVHLVWRREHAGFLLTATVLTAAFFVLPTRVHERYLFAVFALAAPIAAVSRPWLWWYLALAAASSINLFAVLTAGGTPLLTTLPGGVLARSPVAIALSASAITVLAGWAAFEVATGRAPDLPPDDLVARDAAVAGMAVEPR